MPEGQIRAGSLDQRIQIQKPNLTKDNFGDASRSANFKTVREVWASIVPARGYEVRQSLTEMQVLFVTITMRYATAKDVVEGWEFIHKNTGVPYEVRAVSHVDTGRRRIDFTCRMVDRTKAK